MDRIVPSGSDKQDDAHDREEYSLPEQRFRQQVQLSSHGVWHVQLFQTFKSSNHEGRWVRRACDRANLCGSQHCTVVNVDAAQWPTERQPVRDPESITCKRCRDRYHRWLKKHEAVAR